jgi:hypothetical protein
VLTIQSYIFVSCSFIATWTRPLTETIVPACRRTHADVTSSHHAHGLNDMIVNVSK